MLKALSLNLYCSLVRFKLECGCIIYASVRLSFIKILDHFYHQGLMLILAAFRTYVEPSV